MHTLDIQIQFRDLLGLIFEGLGYKEKNPNGKPYAEEKNELLKILLKSGIAPIYIPYKWGDFIDVVKYYHNEKKMANLSVIWLRY